MRRLARHQQPESNQTEELKQFTLELLQAVGALVDVHKDGVVDALLPDGPGKKLGGDHAGFLRLAFDQDAASAHKDAQYVALGSNLTDELIDLAAGMGLATRYYVNGLKWSQRLAVDVGRWKARVANARMIPEGVEFPFACHYVLLNFKVSYISDEKREELQTVLVDSSSLQPGRRLQQAWDKLDISPRREFYAADIDSLPDAAGLGVVYQRAVTILERQIADEIATYRRRTTRHLEMENLRINAFYDDTERELRRRLERAEADQRGETIRRKIEAASLERQRKLADIAAKHQLRVVFALLNAAVVTQPKVRSTVKVENRYASAEVRVIFDPLTGELELPVCQVCAEATEVVHLCANGHVACPNCTLPCSACKREYCAICGVGSCSVCGQPICSHSQVRCPVCGQVTCPTDKGKCHAQ
ncbi:MAG: hypothetical protein HY675_21740 [Chloroflexi bacterium]|nr:hypothetical protein [Chloroflexota bacterium]